MTSSGQLAVAERLEVAADTLRTAFERAAATQAIVAKTYSVSGLVIRVEFVGALAESLGRGLEHLECAGEAAGLVVRAFDSASTGEPVTFDAETIQALVEAGSPAAVPRAQLLAAYRRPDSGVSILDVHARLGHYWVPDGNRVPPWEQAAPFRGIFSTWVARHGRRYVHGAAVGIGGRAALIVGPGGSGKSTTALTCFAAGMDYAGDDYCIVDPASTSVFALYRSAKLHPENLSRVPWLSGRALNEGDSTDKLVYFPKPAGRGRIVSSMKIAAILLPRVADTGPSRLAPVSAGAALAAIAPTTLLQLTNADAAALSDLARLARSVPAYRLDLGPDMDGVVDLIRGLLTT